MHLQQLNGMQCSDLKALHIKGVPFVNRTYTRGLPFLPKLVYKMVTGRTRCATNADCRLADWQLNEINIVVKCSNRFSIPNF